MIPSSQVLTVAQMRAAEQALIDGGETVSSLMEHAGKGAAEWVWRMAGGRPVTVLCGPGNNGGDGYVIARELARRGLDVTVVAPLDPATDAARAARAGYDGSVAEQGQGGVLVDALFGSGLARPLAPEIAELLAQEAARHAYRIAIDVPSGVDSDSGEALNEGLPGFDLTLALGAWKPAHALMPAMAAMGEVRLVPIGVAEVPSAAQLLRRPELRRPGYHDHKYTRGLVLVVEGVMSGAALLACEAAMRAGAGAVRLSTERLHPAVSPDIVLKGEPLSELLTDARTGAVLVGPGLGRDAAAGERLRTVLRANLPTVLDADALALLAPDDLARHDKPLILTPHEGEMTTLAKVFALSAPGKVARAVELAGRTGAVVAYKGADTVIATPDGRVAFAPSATSWLSVGGSGDVLAGIAATRLAATGDAFRATCDAVWLHGEAGRLAGPAFLASDIAVYIPAAYAACL